jgi:hypothetical protein
MTMEFPLTPCFLIWWTYQFSSAICHLWNGNFGSKLSAIIACGILKKDIQAQQLVRKGKKKKKKKGVSCVN